MHTSAFLLTLSLALAATTQGSTTYDVAVIGGGATGTYAAVNLVKAGKKVVLIEKEAVLGGHTNTYVDPATHTVVNYGVQASWGIPVTQNYFSFLNISTGPYDYFPTNTTYVNFHSGAVFANFPPSTNFTAYAAQLAKYPYLQYSWKLPNPVPKDLLQPFSATIAKYNLQDVVFSLFSAGAGVANFLSQLTVNIFKEVDGSYLKASFGGQSLVPASNNNGEIYAKAAAYLGKSVLLSSTVTSAQRATDCCENGVELVIKTPQGSQNIQVSKLLVTIPPLLNNMKPFDLDSTESGLFSQWTYSNYFVLLVSNTGLPADSRFVNANASTSTYHTPPLPAPYFISATRVSGLFYIWYGSPTDMTQAQVQADVVNVIGRLRKLTGSTVTSAPQFVAFKSHTPFKLVVSADAISSRFYDTLESLQGHRNTWYTGAAFLSHDASELWNFTQSVVLPDLLAGCK